MNRIHGLATHGMKLTTLLGGLLAAAPAFAAATQPAVEGVQKLIAYGSCAMGLALATAEPFLFPAMLNCITLMLKEM
jgi:hypothetical protein